MANPLRGETPLPGTEFVLRYDINSICNVEAALGVNMMELMSKLNPSTPTSFSDARLLLWAGLRDQLPDLTLEAAGELFAKVGLLPTLTAIGEAIKNSLGLEQESGSGKATASNR